MDRPKLSPQAELETIHASLQVEGPAVHMARVGLWYLALETDENGELAAAAASRAASETYAFRRDEQGQMAPTDQNYLFPDAQLYNLAHFAKMAEFVEVST